MRNEWVPVERYRELIGGSRLASSRGMEADAWGDRSPPLRPDDGGGGMLGFYGGVGPSIRYRPERRVPRREATDFPDSARNWDVFEFNLEDIENWMAWAASELVRTTPLTHDEG